MLYFFNLFRPEKQGKLQEIPGTLKVIIHKTSPEQPLQSRCPMEVGFFTTHLVNLVCEKWLELPDSGFLSIEFCHMSNGMWYLDTLFLLEYYKYGMVWWSLLEVNSLI